MVRRLSYALVAGTVALTVAAPSTAKERPAAMPLYVFAGQSNMVGYSTVAAALPAIDPTLSKPVDKVRFWGPNADITWRWGPMQAPTEVMQTLSHNGFGPELSAAPLLVRKHHGHEIAIVKLAVNGTSLHWDWNPSREHGLYRQLVDRVQYARKMLRKDTGRSTRIAGIFWMQGEADAARHKDAISYGRNLTNFVHRLRGALGAPNAKFVIGQVSNVRKQYPVAMRYVRIVRRQQFEVARWDPRIYLVSTAGLAHDVVSPIHYDSKATVELGRRFAKRLA